MLLSWICSEMKIVMDDACGKEGLRRWMGWGQRGGVVGEGEGWKRKCLKKVRKYC